MVHSSVKITSLNWRSLVCCLSSHHFNRFSLFVSVISAQYLLRLHTQPSSLLALLTELMDVLTPGNSSSSFWYSCLEVSSLFSAIQLSMYLYCSWLRDLRIRWYFLSHTLEVSLYLRMSRQRDFLLTLISSSWSLAWISFRRYFSFHSPITLSLVSWLILPIVFPF